MLKFYTCLLTILLSVAFFAPCTMQAQNCWSALGPGNGNNNYDSVDIETMITYNGNLIVAGVFNNIGGVPAANIASWNGTSWSPLGAGTDSKISNYGYYQGVYALAVYNGALYAAGSFDTAGGQPTSRIAKWDGTSWTTLGTGINGYIHYGPFDSISPQVTAMAVYNGELYVGGQFTGAGNVVTNDIIKWNGTAWSAVGSGLAAGQDVGYTGVIALTVADNTLYAGGDFNNASGVPAVNITAWNGTAWQALGTGLGNDTAGRSDVTAIASYQGEVYAAVDNTDNSGNPIFSISKWNGTNWTGVVGGPGTGLNYAGYVFSLLPFGGNLVAAGEFAVIGNDSAASGLAQYNGTAWSNLGNGPDSSLYIRLADYNSHLYVAGFYVEISGTPVVNIAELTCVTSSVADVAIENHVRVFPNPNNGIVTVSVENVNAGTIELYNLLGEKVYAAAVNAATQLDLSGRAAGTYLYRISGEDGKQIAAGSLVIR